MAVRSFTNPSLWRIEESGSGLALVARPPVEACIIGGVVMVGLFALSFWFLSGLALAAALVCGSLPLVLVGGQLAAEWRAGPALVWEKEAGVVRLPRMKQSYAMAEVRRLEIVEDRLMGRDDQVSVLELVVQGQSDPAERRVAICGALGPGGVTQLGHELADRMQVGLRQRITGKE